MDWDFIRKVPLHGNMARLINHSCVPIAKPSGLGASKLREIANAP